MGAGLDASLESATVRTRSCSWLARHRDHHVAEARLHPRHPRPSQNQLNRLINYIAQLDNGEPHLGFVEFVAEEEESTVASEVDEGSNSGPSNAATTKSPTQAPKALPARASIEK